MNRRRLALKSMLDAAEARHERASRRRLPTLAAGVKVRVVQGQHAPCEGIVLDADFIESRVLLHCSDALSAATQAHADASLTSADSETPRYGKERSRDRIWVNFADLAPVISEAE